MTAGISPQNLSSPGWPSRYYNNLQCEWRIEASAGLQVQLTIMSLEIELDYDVLEVISVAIYNLLSKHFNEIIKVWVLNFQIAGDPKLI